MAGERLFLDYAGDGVPVVIDRLTGEIRMAQIFVAVLGASSFTYARATWTQTLADWIDAHTHAFAAIGGVPHLLVPDNTKAAVIKACLYDPLVNRTYAEMAAHYDTAILPARPRRPRDKAKVEQAVLIVERWLLGRLRHRIFYSLADVNAAIGELLALLNEERPIRRLGATRRQLLEEIDRPALKPLPIEPYEFCEWRACRVGIDYHVEADAHYYSVHHRFARTDVDVRLTARTVEVYLKGERIAAHTLAQDANYSSVEATSDKPVQLSYHASAHKNCTPAALPTIRVIESPKSGTLTVRRAVLTTDKVAGCPGLKTPAQAVFYLAHAGYAGPDHVKYEVTTENGEVATYDVTITVKAAPAQSPPATGDRPL